MSRTARALPALGFDVFSTAVGLAIISGALSILQPFLELLTATLATLAVAAWTLSRTGASPDGRPAVRRREFMLWVPAAVAALAYLAPGVPVGPFRGLFLAASLVPVWAAGRRGVGRTLPRPA